MDITTKNFALAGVVGLSIFMASSPAQACDFYKKEEKAEKAACEARVAADLADMTATINADSEVTNKEKYLKSYEKYLNKREEIDYESAKDQAKAQREHDKEVQDELKDNGLQSEDQIVAREAELNGISARLKDERQKLATLRQNAESGKIESDIAAAMASVAATIKASNPYLTDEQINELLKECKKCGKDVSCAVRDLEKKLDKEIDQHNKTFGKFAGMKARINFQHSKLEAKKNEITLKAAEDQDKALLKVGKDGFIVKNGKLAWGGIKNVGGALVGGAAAAGGFFGKLAKNVAGIFRCEGHKHCKEHKVSEPVSTSVVESGPAPASEPSSIIPSETGEKPAAPAPVVNCPAPSPCAGLHLPKIGLNLEDLQLELEEGVPSISAAAAP